MLHAFTSHPCLSTQHCYGKTLPGVLLVLAASCPNSALAAAAGETEFSWWWNLVIAMVVLVFSLASASLPLAAWRQWRGAWRYAAAAPMAGLIFWALLIVVGRISDPASHRLWPFEIFAWAMLTTIYMVAVMTTKRIFEKADQESASGNE